MWQNLLEKLKKLHKSWTIWFNALLGMAIYNWDTLLANFPQLQDYLPHDIYRWGMTVLVFGNFILRIKTNKPLDQK